MGSSHPATQHHIMEDLKSQNQGGEILRTPLKLGLLLVLIIRTWRRNEVYVEFLCSSPLKEKRE